MEEYVRELHKILSLQETEERLAVDMEQLLGRPDPELRGMIRAAVVAVAP